MHALLGIFCASTALTTTPLTDDRIELRSGDTVTGEIVERSDEHIVIEHEVFGRLTIPMDEIVSLPEDDEAPVEDAVDEPMLEDKPSPWKSQIEIGLSGAQGNTDTLSFRAGFLTVKETADYRWRIDASYNYGETDGNTNKNQATAGVLRDWLFPESPILYFAQGRYDYDDFRDWRHRLSGHGGIGYEIIDTETFELIGRVGAGAAKEWQRSQSIRPEGLLGLEFAWTISDRQSLTGYTTLYPDLGDFFEFRVVSGIKWTMQIDAARGLALNAGIDNEYESQTDPGIKNNDLRFYAGLTFQF